jgi:transcriptional regulator EpsA
MAGDFNGLTSLTPSEIDHLFFTIESSLQMRRRYQFYIWAQSRLFTLIPHDMLICAHYDYVRKCMSYDSFSMFPIPRGIIEGSIDPVNGLMPKLLEVWLATQGTPCTINLDHLVEGESAELAADLREAGISEVLTHGMMSSHEENVVETFFIFSRVFNNLIPAQIKRELSPITARHSFMLEMLLPHLHATYTRTLQSQERTRERPAAAPAPGLVAVTEREREILGWVREGMSNQAIGALLDISPLTVKNHIQKILRKLKATNRAQAVSKALSLRLITQTSDAS